MKKTKRLIAVGLTAVFLAACGGGNGGEVTPTPTPGQTNDGQVSQNGDGNDAPGDAAPSPYEFTETPMNLNGRTITMLAVDARNHWDYDRVDVDRTPNETLRVIDILREIEEDYNATIEIYWHPASGLLQMLVANRAVGDAPFDLLELNLSDFTVNSLWSQRLVMPVSDPAISHVIKPLENPWKATEFTTFGGVQFAVHFKPFNTPTVLRDVITFNETHRQTLDLPNFYDMVRDRTWTWDNFESILNDIVVRSNGEIFPMIYWHESGIIPPMIAANNGTIAQRTPGGGLVFVGAENGPALHAMNTVQDWMERNWFHPYAPRSGHFATGVGVGGVMSRGDAFFAFGEYALIKNLTRQAVGYQNEFNFGIIPTPIGPNATEFTSVITSEMLYHVMNDIDRPEEAAAILVAIANRTAQRTYRVIAHELNYTLQTMDSAQMLEIMLNNIVVDVSRIHGASRSGGGSGIVAAGLRILRLETTPVQAMQEISAMVQHWFDELDALGDEPE
jgi:ABC-type glycerol-3-phosphate transport system substrate-binding protein